MKRLRGDEIKVTMRQNLHDNLFDLFIVTPFMFFTLSDSFTNISVALLLSGKLIVVFIHIAEQPLGHLLQILPQHN
jgi:hypothetical protein